MQNRLDDPSIYPSMAAQLRGAEIRSLIELQQRQSILYRQRMTAQIQKIQQSIRNKGIGIQEGAVRIKSLKAEQFNLREQIKDATRIIGGFKEGTFKVGVEIDQERSGIVKQRFNVGQDYDNHLKHKSALHEAQIEGINVDRQAAEKGLISILNQRLDQKRHGRQKLIQIEQDILNLQMNREAMEVQIVPKIAERDRRKYDELFRDVQRKVAQDEAVVASLKRKNEYLYKQLTDDSLKDMEKIGRIQTQIANIQALVKKLHDDMTKTNMQIQTKHTCLQLMHAQEEQKQDSIRFRRQQINNIMSDGNQQLDLVRLQVAQQRKTMVDSQERVHQRVLQLQKAIREQQVNNKNIKGQYDKICSMLVIGCQGAMQTTMTYAAPDIISL